MNSSAPPVKIMGPPTWIDQIKSIQRVKSIIKPTKKQLSIFSTKFFFRNFEISVATFIKFAYFSPSKWYISIRSDARRKANL